MQYILYCMVLVCELSNVYTIYYIVLLSVGIHRNPNKTLVNSTVCTIECCEREANKNSGEQCCAARF
jgi:hypothetical protein